MTTRVKMIITAFVGVGIQFGLAVWGWGGWDAFFAHPAFQELAWVTLFLTVFSCFAPSSGLSSGVREDRGNRWVLSLFSVIAILVTYFSAFTDRLDFLTFGGDTTRWIGVVVMAAGGLLRIAPVFVLKDRFSGLVAIQPDHKLETRGMYGTIRNPSYLGMLVASLGWAVAFRSGVGVILSLTLLVPIVVRVGSEERLLREHFGAEYEAYCARTWRLLPWVY